MALLRKFELILLICEVTYYCNDKFIGLVTAVLLGYLQFSCSFKFEFFSYLATNSDSGISCHLQEKTANPVAKEELGRATWTFLHTLAAQVIS